MSCSFGQYRVDDLIFPLCFDYWIQEQMLAEEEVYFKKTEIADFMLDNLIEQGLEFDYISFDAGFCSPELLYYIDNKGFKFICRFPKSRKFTIKTKKENEKDRKETAKAIFENEHNGSFYYDRMGWNALFIVNTVK